MPWRMLKSLQGGVALLNGCNRELANFYVRDLEDAGFERYESMVGDRFEDRLCNSESRDGF